MYKVFFEDRIFILSEIPVIKYIDKQNLVYKYKDPKNLKENINTFRINTSIQRMNIYNNNKNILLKVFSGFFTCINAAGGIVKNNKGNILFIYRRGKWDLPKGKVEENEETSMAAIREVTEECGISDLTISRFLKISYHTYLVDNIIVLKKTWWYEMLYNGTQSLVPQLEEDITEICWMNQDNLDKPMGNTYESIKDLLFSYIL